MTLVTPNRLQDETPVLGVRPESPQAVPSARGGVWGSVRFLVAVAGFGLEVIWQMTRSAIRRALKRRPIIKRVERESTPRPTAQPRKPAASRR